MSHPFTLKLLFQFLATVSPKAITLGDDNFSMVGQAALQGLLKKVRDLGLLLRYGEMKMILFSGQYATSVCSYATER